MKGSPALAVAGVIATTTGAMPLTLITSDSALLSETALFALVLLGTGVAVRATRLPSALAPVAEAFVWLGAGALLVSRLAPGASVAESLSTAFSTAMQHVATHTAPMPPEPSVRFLLVMSVGLSAILVDCWAIAARTPGAALIPTGLPFGIVTVAAPTGVTPAVFAPVALGWCLILIAAEYERARAWPSHRVEAPNARPGLRGGSALVATVGVLTVSLVSASLLPSLQPMAWQRGNGSRLVLSDPNLDLRRALVEQSDETVLQYSTDAPTPTYLRAATLARFDEGGWTPASQSIRYGAVPDVPGFTSTSAPRYTTNVDLVAMTTQWLPLPYAPRGLVTGAGSWGFSAESLDAIGDKPLSSDMSYTVEWVDVRPTSGQLATASVGNPREGVTARELPSDLPDQVHSLAQQLTAGQPTPHGRAMAIQRYLRSSPFRYSTSAQPGSGYDALTRFLFDDHTGYCEQFAAAFAVLGRAAGLPTRVVIGFTPGKRVGDGYVVTGREMHAWPEVFYDGLGWVGYEPTPGVANPPAYAVDSPQPTAATTTGGDAANPSPSRRPSASASSAPTGHPSGGGFADVVIQAGVLAIVALVAGVVVPVLIRRRRHAVRLKIARGGDSTTRAEAAWAEVRDSVIDAGREWPMDTPRRTATLVTTSLPKAADPMAAIAGAIEQARYARSPAVPDDLSQSVVAVRQALRDEATALQAWKGAALPRSVWRGDRRRF